MSRRRVVQALGGALSIALSAGAEEPAGAPPAAPAAPAASATPATDAAPEAADAKLEQARRLYRRGVDRVRRQQWSEALSAFERSAAVRPHATTTFNIAACERALGNYTRARSIFRRALAQSEQAPETLAPSLRTEAGALLEEIERGLVRVAVRLEPAHAAISVDGRPLARADEAGRVVLVAGVEPPGPGKPPPASRFELVMNPGAHVITLSREGYADAVVRKSYAPGSKKTLELGLERLPATLRISANVPGALVRVSEVDVGPAPAEVLRPAGNYRVVVHRTGFEPYETSVTMRPGQESNLRATLRPESQAITGKWWFWTGAVAVVAAGALVTYALTRPEPEPPPYDGGSTGWVVQPSAVRF